MVITFYTPPVKLNSHLVGTIEESGKEAHGGEVRRGKGQWEGRQGTQYPGIDAIFSLISEVRPTGRKASRRSKWESQI